MDRMMSMFGAGPLKSTTAGVPATASSTSPPSSTAEKGSKPERSDSTLADNISITSATSTTEMKLSLDQNQPHIVHYPGQPPFKRTRSTRACDTCRRKRTKCTGNQPCEGCISFGLACTYTAPQKKRGPPKRTEAQKPAGTTLGERLKTVESLLSGLISTVPFSIPGMKRPRSDSASSMTSDQYDDDDDFDGEEDEKEDSEEDPGFCGIALAIQRPTSRKVAAAHATSVDATDANTVIAPTFCQVPWRAGVTVTDPERGVLVQRLSLDQAVVSHHVDKERGNITIVEDDVADTVLFYGSTSAANTHSLRKSPRYNDGVMSIALRSDVVPVSSSGSVDAPPCSPDLVHHLVSVYFSHIHPYFPMIDKASFARHLKEKQTEHFSLLLNSMCALVTQQVRSLTAWGISSTAELHRAFFERARTLLGKQFDWPHIHNVQALLLLTLVGAGTNTNAASYQYIGIAHRHAVELGMHRNLDKVRHVGLNDAMKEQMRATWFCLYIIDRYTGVHQGRPFAINDDDWDTPLPRQEEAGDLSLMIHHVSLCSILGQIANYLNRPSLSGVGIRRASRPRREDLVREIDVKLAEWFSTLPQEFKEDPKRGPDSWSFHHHINVMYHTTVILLQRVSTGRFGGKSLESAMAITKTFEALPAGTSNCTGRGDDFVFIMPVVVYAGLTASTLFLDMAVDRVSAPDRKSKRPRLYSDPSEASHIAMQNGLDPIEEMKKSMPVFEKLKDISQFAVYYGQLIDEGLKGMVLAGDAPVAMATPEEQLGPVAAGPPQTEGSFHATGVSTNIADIPPEYMPDRGTTMLPGMPMHAAFQTPLPLADGTLAPGPYPSPYVYGMHPPQLTQLPTTRNPTNAPYFVDSVFAELLNPYFPDTGTGWWGDPNLPTDIAALNGGLTLPVHNMPVEQAENYPRYPVATEALHAFPDSNHLHPGLPVTTAPRVLTKDQQFQ
ncbi:fungal-specific transcription factor domain-containing protein [Gaertneriomyces semiglobifer]|nr:fungal-specific transcription factor domain-containing protein [Gaertneriomyces semiglobifer]